MKTKNYSLKYQETKNYLIAEVIGNEDSIETSIAYWNEIFKKSEDVNLSKILVVESFKTQLSTEDMHKACVHISNLFLQHPCKIAFIDLEQDHNNLNKMGELIVQNRDGLLKIFDNKKNAVHWLNG